MAAGCRCGRTRPSCRRRGARPRAGHGQPVRVDPRRRGAVVPLVLAAGYSGSTSLGEASAAQTGPGGGIPAGPAPGPEALSETGSTLLYPVLRNWAAAYRQQYPNVSIATAATGSGKGIAEASA